MMRHFGALLAGVCALAVTPAAAEEGFYQYPSARGDVLVFASEGDLWRTGREGGSAVRLTNHAAEEAEAHISPDGTMVAFSASYDSERDVYVMPVAGGTPRRLTFEGGFVQTIGWTPDGRVIFASRLAGGGQGEVLYTISPQGGEATPIPLWRATDATFGRDGQTLFFSRRGLYARARDNAVLYRGGGMAQLWRWTMGSDAEATRLLADFGAPIRHPMAANGRIWFLSDKSGKDALWSVAEDGSDVRQVSPDLPFPVLQASIDGNAAFLQNGADIHVVSLASGAMRKLAIDLVTDREQTRARALGEPLKQLEAARISPSGETVAVTARGRVALAAPKQLRRIEFAVPMEARARQAVLGPEAERAFMILDSGERGDIFAMAADGSGAPVAVTKGYDAHIWSFALAPDEKTLVVWDKEARLQKVDVATGRVTLLARNTTGDDAPFRDLVFSRDGKLIAYAETSAAVGGNTSDIYVQNLATGERVKATSGKYNDYAPAFAHDGAWLYFISDRNFDPSPGSPWGDRNMGVAFPDRGEIYALQLDPDATFGFREDNELTLSEAAREKREAEATEGDSAKSKGKDEAAKPAAKPANIVLAGLAERLYKVPAKSGVGGQLFANEKFLYTYRDDNIVAIAIDKSDPKEEIFAKGARDFALAADGKTALVVSGAPASPALALVPAEAKMPEKLAPHLLRLDDWRLVVDPKAEWRQMFVDAWRMHRDFAYDPALRGVDWNAVRQAHEPMLERIGHRGELNTILGLMASQLGILHSQVRAGDLPGDSENPDMAFLGASTTPVAQGLRIDRILRSDDDLVSLRPPLRRPGVDAREGDVIRFVDGRPVASLADLRLALAGKAGQQVRLDLVRGVVKVSTIVEPMTLQGLQTASYLDHVEVKRAATAQLSDGQIGYISLRAMGSGDVASFARDWFPQLSKPGLVIDVRNNNGGNIDSIIVGMLMRRAWAFWAKPDGTGIPTTNMQNAYRGHVAVLIDERTYSDGETFAGAVKALGLAPLIGQRTAGAGIWLSDRNRLADNGGVRIAENAQYSIDGRWIVEGYGISPDYEVDNPPAASFTGEDAQLRAAVALLKDKIAREPVPALVPRPLPSLGTPGADVFPLPGR
ncbi:S41 family peptidase [Erythrobacter dokdonensis]|uniref:Tricorn protease homolog n=1 Tax=Erythrobacter dokdonensis DSW-74 TaxID=1300349 RepID=A0A1A7BKZ6_9SPHN|nr:S41 family peptidase [Erythrobacter dokdonensis]OBV12396.1 Protease [Erythrobacter dokdonensis DSW-74]